MAGAGVEVGDHVYVRHPTRGPCAMQVLATGKDGFTAKHPDGTRHQLPYEAVLGHKSRIGVNLRPIDSGADGGLYRDDSGRARYVRHAEEDGDDSEGGADAEPADGPDDPLIDGLERLKKSFTPLWAFPEGVKLLFKSAAVANRPGLVLRDVLTKTGPSKRDGAAWAAEPAAKQESVVAKAKPWLKHGDFIGFQHGQVEGEGRIVASGRDGVTLQDERGQEHQIRHADLRPRPSLRPLIEAIDNLPECCRY